MPVQIVLSHYQARPLLQARQRGVSSVATSADLGLSSVDVSIQAQGVTFPGGAGLRWSTLEMICEQENACFLVSGAAATKIQAFSDYTGRFYSLMPTSGAPTLLVSGIPMHRIKDTDPYRDTLCKAQALSPMRGRVLDTATGLGYTAIEAAKTAEEVVTVELDPMVLEIARLNPWSQTLFSGLSIHQQIGNGSDAIRAFADESFSCILHDPPTFSLAGELYSLAFYQQAHRVLKPRGRMYHYVGSPERQSGAGVTRGVVRRLKQAGFRQVRPRPEAFGLVAYK
jgi:predicted methyltransferase